VLLGILGLSASERSILSGRLKVYAEDSRKRFAVDRFDSEMAEILARFVEERSPDHQG